MIEFIVGIIIGVVVGLALDYKFDILYRAVGRFHRLNISTLYDMFIDRFESLLQKIKAIKKDIQIKRQQNKCAKLQRLSRMG